MLPENRMNPMGLSSQSSASMMGAMGDATNSALPSESSTEVTVNPLQVVAKEFHTLWKQLESMNGKLGGDADKFRQVQVALEGWFADVASKLPEATAPTSPQTPTY